MTGALFALKSRVPQGVDPSRWQAAVEWTAVAHFNAFHLWHPPPIEEVYRLRAELMPKLRQPMDMQTLAWAWDRIGHGRRRQGHHGQTWASIPELLRAGYLCPTGRRRLE